MCVIKFATVKGCEDFLVNPDLSDGPGTSHRGRDGSFARSLFTHEAETTPLSESYRLRGGNGLLELFLFQKLLLSALSIVKLILLDRVLNPFVRLGLWHRTFLVPTTCRPPDWLTG